MPVHVRIKDFQSIADAELVVDRLTVVTGANNSGKTAVVRAVRGVFSNGLGDACVRYGREKFSITLAFDDGQTVTWEKGAKIKPTYIINGKKLHPGRGVPEEVSVLGISPIQVGQMPVWPQIAEQFTGQVFLLDLPGSHVAEAVADVDRVGDLTQALRYAESDKRSASDEMRLRKKDVITLEQELDSYAGVGAVGDAVTAVEALVATATKVASTITFVEGQRTKMHTFQSEIASLQGVREVAVPPPGIVVAAQALGADYRTLCALRARLQNARADSTRLSGIRHVTVAPLPTDVATVRTAIADAQLMRGRVEAARVKVARSRLAREAASGVALDGTQETVATAQKAARTIAVVQKYRDDLAAGRAEINRLRLSLSAKKTTVGEAEAEVRRLLDEMGVCPICQSPIVGSHPHKDS